MSDDDDLREKVGRVINDFGAELTVMRVILRGLVARVVLADPAFAEEQIEQMREDALDALGRASTNPENAASQEQRIRALQEQHVDKFFRALSVAASELRNRSGQAH
jgi:hypothetical protein